MAGTRFAYVRTFELPDPLLPNTFIVVRIDGHGFHRSVVGSWGLALIFVHLNFFCYDMEIGNTYWLLVFFPYGRTPDFLIPTGLRSQMTLAGLIL